MNHKPTINVDLIRLYFHQIKKRPQLKMRIILKAAFINNAPQRIVAGQPNEVNK